MSQRSVFCIEASRDLAARMVRSLKQHTFPGAEISVLFLDGRAPAPGASDSRAVAGTTRPARVMRQLLRRLTGLGRRVTRRSRTQPIDQDPRTAVHSGSRLAGTSAEENFTIVEVTTTKLSLLNALANCHAAAA